MKPEQKENDKVAEEPEEARPGIWAWLKKRLLAIIMIVLAVVISAALFIYRDIVVGLGEYGYLGAFLISLIGSATIILPVPAVVALFAIGTVLNPVLVGLVGATGSTIGELTGFILGYGSGEMIKKGKTYALAEKWMKRWGLWAVFVIAATLPFFDIAGIIAGALRYPLWKFMLVGWAGKCIKYVVLVWAGARGWEFLLGWFS